MKKLALYTLLTVFVAALLLGVTWQAEAQAVRIPVHALEIDCLVDEGTSWMSGNVLHLRDVVHVNFEDSDNPQLDGMNTTVAAGDINMKNGSLSIRGTMLIEPATIDGTWVGHWNFTSNKGVTFGKAVGHGTGALHGQTLFMDLYDYYPNDVEMEHAVEICETVGGTPEPTFSTIEGYILVGGGK